MEFNEKLQYLRKQHNLTQEQLAEKLFVSRTAVSKWESGRGYPSIESLKCISKAFGISIDELLSGEELIVAAEVQNSLDIRRTCAAAMGLLDMLAVAGILLPLYGNPAEGFVRSVSLLSFTAAADWIRAAYWVALLALIAAGGFELLSVRLGRERWSGLGGRISMGLSAAAILFFAAAKEPYAVTLLFLLFAGKLFLAFRQHKNGPTR